MKQIVSENWPTGHITHPGVPFASTHYENWALVPEIKEQVTHKDSNIHAICGVSYLPRSLQNDCWKRTMTSYWLRQDGKAICLFSFSLSWFWVPSSLSRFSQQHSCHWTDQASHFRWAGLVMDHYSWTESRSCWGDNPLVAHFVIWQAAWVVVATHELKFALVH